ncbi:uncharacterized protein LOC127866083 [Dreissena polymorpha]|uniref:uncharacterized protein LOC127866083 n=1 Tax=Dreissena polymorpha TaxID=45954 RepID=UPI002263F5B1|nr:uncharacterized protein LOC127866083 [Dreissena polymorpha]
MTNKQSLVTRGKPLPGVSDRAIVFIEVARKSLRKRLSRSKKKAYRKAQLNSTPEDITKYKQLQNNTQQECKKAYNNFVRDTVTSYKNPKKILGDGYQIDAVLLDFSKAFDKILHKRLAIKLDHYGTY